MMFDNKCIILRVLLRVFIYFYNISSVKTSKSWDTILCLLNEILQRKFISFRIEFMAVC